MKGEFIHERRYITKSIHSLISQTHNEYLPYSTGKLVRTNKQKKLRIMIPYPKNTNMDKGEPMKLGERSGVRHQQNKKGNKTQCLKAIDNFWWARLHS